MLLFEIWSLGYKPFPFLADSREVSCIPPSTSLAATGVVCDVRSGVVGAC